MKAILVIFMLLPSISWSVNHGLEIDLPKTWTEVPPKIIPGKDSYIYAPKKKSKSLVILQQSEYRPAFPNVKKELFHQCRVYPEGSGEIIKEKNISYCLIEKSKTALILSKKNKKSFLNSFRFQNMEKTEVKNFLKHVRIK